MGGGGGWGGQKGPPSLKSKMSHTYIAMMKLRADIPYLKKIQKIYYSRETALQLC